jgi:hypothetical protein
MLEGVDCACQQHTLPDSLPACLPLSDSHHTPLLQGALDNINLFQVITIMAFFMLLPVSILFEGAPILPHKMAAAVSESKSSARHGG